MVIVFTEPQKPSNNNNNNNNDLLPAEIGLTHMDNIEFGLESRFRIKTL